MMEISGLAYVVAETTDMAKWSDYAQQVLGAMTERSPEGSLRVKIDERQFRILVVASKRDAYAASGWEVRDAGAFAAAVAALEQASVTFTRGDKALCAERCVQQLVAFDDPSGNRHEIVWGFKSDFRRFASPVGVARFVTGDIGMGHAVLPATIFDATVAFFREVMGFGLSDLFNFQPAGPDGPTLPIHFLHCANGRHHSLAFAGFPVESGCVHIMLEVESMPEVGRALDRMAAHSVPLSATLGQHTNDRVTSFYMKSPSGFDIEYGYGGAVVDWKQHIAHEFTAVSLWGHDFTVGRKG
ncbi:MAG TPA: VOC family protein [Paraburkholderia sp.]|jgi:3,4-dihydroxy-9,10-secoandrosta-1,3,5(10)-triene-9,17-dione 4,5-dioxygenase|uniref:VOC family protein n=1 Tax=Paraburkholderia sp. TaxID=1926495 RepID=UPI002B471A45|nr:VOC family protein [Paraburkholderia sp.]HKR40204.1 VOC family protein [Paraburkholderia sp.]